jgi:hypothetical protein
VEQQVFQANVDERDRGYKRIVQAGIALQKASGVDPLLHDGVLSLTAPTLVNVHIDEHSRDINVQVKSPGACDEWVPGAEELAEVGIEVTMQEKTIDRDGVARAMHDSKERIYFGRLSEVQARGDKHDVCAAPAPAAAVDTNRTAP